jgi:hypothetical protein
VNGHLPAPAALPLGNQALVHIVQESEGFGTGLNAVEKIKIFTCVRNQTQILRPFSSWPSHYND